MAADHRSGLNAAEAAEGQSSAAPTASGDAVPTDDAVAIKRRPAARMILLRQPVRQTSRIKFVCWLQAGPQAQAGFTGFFLPLPGTFFSGLLFDRRSGLFAAAIAVFAAAYLSYFGHTASNFCCHARSSH